jgi:pilus assembly protein Flp/PilA
MKQLIDFLRKQEGATAVEYAIMVSFIAAVIFSVITLLGTQVIGLFQSATEGW